MSDTLPAILSIDEAAAYLRCSVKTVRRQVAAGKLRFFFVGKAYRFHRADIEQFTKAAPVVNHRID